MRRRPKIRGTQIGLKNPALVDSIKAAIREGHYAYVEPRGQIAGYVDPRGVYHIVEGHHRMAAALEVEDETGDSTAVLTLLLLGTWKYDERPPRESRPMPARDWWGWLRNKFRIG
jgi:filamentous hemagglutinin